MTAPKQHHFVPKQYLKRFCDPQTPSRIYVYESGSGRSFAANIGKIAREKDFYLPEIEDDLATKIEGPADRHLAKVLRGERLTHNEKWLFAEYIAVLIKRVPAYRKKIDSILLDTTAEEMKKIQDDINEHVTDPELKARRLREVLDLQHEWQDGLSDDVRHYVEQPWMTAGIVQAIFSMSWHYFKIVGPSRFATSDNPVFWFDGLGLGNAYSEFSVPLSSDVCLVATRADFDDQLHLDAGEKIVKEVNRRAITNAVRHVYYYRDVEWLRRMAAKGRYSGLKRIYVVPQSGRPDPLPSCPKTVRQPDSS